MHLERLIRLLEIVAVVGRPVTASEVQAASGIPKPTCYRLFQTLLEQGLIEEPNEDGRYIIGERLIRIALLGKSDIDVRRVSAPLLRSAAETYNETVFLARFRDNRIEIIHVETPKDPGRAFIHPGIGERPMHACSCSKAIAAFAEPDFQETILNGTLKAFTDHTKTTRKDLMDEFSLIKKQGYADCDQEIDIGISSVAAPVAVGRIGVTFSVGAVGPVRRFGHDYRQEIGAQLKELATKISAAIQLCNVGEV
ncbi:IclR family transcriptional regulator [Ruegeria sp. ANG-S4]|uniref:IclR family transcriptional regulator n=1 Tax=Ruegeria sp. ANG-S4 TaxID=1577904 RepID=UPI00057D8C02|nr:IclR family transcriptional regulator [Ruegeria sp. ANG-S4]KIC45812.1 IclR family transcriptional regulator [Ruegeria sp. ANG-S4]